MQIIISLMALVYGLRLYYKYGRNNGCIVRLIYFELIYNLLIKYVIGNLHFPSILNYITDLILVLILIEFFYQKKRFNIQIPKSMVKCISLFWIVSIISYVVNLYSPLLYLWGFRNNFRFLLYAMMCALYLEKDDIEKIMDILFAFLVFNILVVTYQAFFVDYGRSSSGDFISGLFSNGMERGGNASLNWLMCIVCTYLIIRYLNKEENLYRMLVAIVGSVYMSTVSEIKFFFFQIIFIGVVALILCKKSYKTVFFTFSVIAIVIIGIRTLYLLFPEFSDFFQMESIFAYVTRDSGYGSSIRNGAAGIDRLTAIPYILNNFLPDSAQRIIGIGLGNADYSSTFSSLTSKFYSNYHLIGYQFFYAPFLLIEMGYLGLISYLIIIFNYAKAALKLPKQVKENKTIKYFTMIIAGMVPLMMMSNQTMKIEASGYMVHCILTFPFIMLKDNVSES